MATSLRFLIIGFGSPLRLARTTWPFGLCRSDGGWRIVQLTLTLDNAFLGGARQCVRRIVGCLQAAPGYRLGRRSH